MVFLNENRVLKQNVYAPNSLGDLYQIVVYSVEIKNYLNKFLIFKKKLTNNYSHQCERSNDCSNKYSICYWCKGYPTTDTNIKYTKIINSIVAKRPIIIDWFHSKRWSFLFRVCFSYKIWYFSKYLSLIDDFFFHV
jgi:hypothetical protein